MKKSILAVVTIMCTISVLSFSNLQRKVQNYYCEQCGAKFSSISDLTSNRCLRGKGMHKLYEGTEKNTYLCKYCGRKFSNIKELTANRCIKNPSGDRHSPAL